MTVIICAGCGKAVPDQWKPCPHCGANPRSGRKPAAGSARAGASAAAGKRPDVGIWGLALVAYGVVFTWVPVYFLAAPAFAALVVGGFLCLVPLSVQKPLSGWAKAGLVLLAVWFVLVFVVFVLGA